MKLIKIIFGLFIVSILFVCLPEVDGVNAAQLDEIEKADMEVDEEQNTGDFIIEDGHLVEYRGYDAKVVIPDNVTSISQFAFMGNKEIVDVTIPCGVTVIDEMSFYNCTALETVQLPETLRYIWSLAFAETKLSYVVLPESLKTIGGAAFANCTSLKGVQMPQHPIEIHDYAFAACENLDTIDLSAVEFMGEGVFDYTALKQVDISSLERVWSEKGGGMFTDTDIDFSGLEHLAMDTSEANPFRDSRYWKEYGKGEKKNTFWIVDGVLLSGQNCSGKVEIPETVTRIAPFAFAGNDKITSVSIPDTVTAVGRGAFLDCMKLKTVGMRDSVTKLGKEAFHGCIRLSEIRLSNRIEVLAEELFYGCQRLTELTLPGQTVRLEPFSLHFSPYAEPKKITLPIGDLEEYGVYLDIGDTLYVTDLRQVEQSPVLVEWAQRYGIKELALNETRLTLHVGEKYPLRFNSGAKATWKSSKKFVATVGITGNIYAKKPGVTVITATIYGKEYTCRVEVVEK
ncbi:MAG: leucine-rich repeat domain-containing protein [Lachnospiraceae bacterium]|nr:leucine-rich repeat domain-containing protein [Lachnospiraceae bacterium]